MLGGGEALLDSEGAASAVSGGAGQVDGDAGTRRLNPGHQGVAVYVQGWTPLPPNRSQSIPVIPWAGMPTLESCRK